MALLPKPTYRLNPILVKIPTGFFTELEKNPKIYLVSERSRISKATLSNKNKAGGTKRIDLKFFYKATVIKRAQCWNKSRCGSMENNRESRQPQAHSTNWSLTKGPKTYTEGKIASLTNIAGKTGYPYAQE